MHESHRLLHLFKLFIILLVLLEQEGTPHTPQSKPVQPSGHLEGMTVSLEEASLELLNSMLEEEAAYTLGRESLLGTDFLLDSESPMEL